ncbi:MAG: glutathione peroxidase [Treponema sp. CETP13]|nr:MAG: glutathione peroxidase [Treponema sp. CETP13]
MNVYDFTVKDLDNNDVSLGDYKNKVLLIVNTAIKCGFTPQYPGLEDLYEKYKDKGFEILDFPCNQFANQAPGTAKEINAVCSGRFGVTFKQFAKINVNGKDESPLYTYLKQQQHGFFGKSIKWNFTKFLVNRNGNVVKRFGSKATPEEIEADIVAFL